MVTVSPDDVRKWAIGTGTTGAVAVIVWLLYLQAIGAIAITAYSGDSACAGIPSDPCYAYINFTANQPISMTVDKNLFETSPSIESWKLYKKSGKNWVEINLSKSISLSKNTRYEWRITGIKKNPRDTVKWSVFSGKIDPVWWNITYDRNFPINCSSAEIGDPVVANGSGGFNLGCGNQMNWVDCQVVGAGLAMYFNSTDCSKYTFSNTTNQVPYEVELGNVSSYSASSVWDKNFTIVLHFAKMMNATAILDSSQKANDVELCTPSKPWYNITGAFGNGMNNTVDGSNSCFYISDTTSYEFQNLTVELYYNPSTAPMACSGDHALFSTQGTGGYFQRWDTGNHNTMWSWTGSWIVTPTGGTCPVLNQWQRFVYARDQVTQRVYENATIISSIASSGTVTNWDTTFAIGGSHNIGSYSTMGFYDEFRLSNINRSAAYINTTWQNYMNTPGYGSFDAVQTYAGSPSNSCSYTSPGSFRVNLSDGCNLTSAVVINGGFETYGGPGYVSINANISNASYVSLTSAGGACTPTTCEVRCGTGGCIGK